MPICIRGQYELFEARNMYKLAFKTRLKTGLSYSGFSAIEILIVLVILGLLVSIAVPSYENYKDKKDIALAKEGILTIQTAIEKFYVLNNRYPDSLSEIGMQQFKDPWNMPYYYLNVATTNNNGTVRKDKNLTPVNSDYDLYSAGKDKQTKLPFTAQASKDDIVRCNNGRFIGLVENY